MTKLAHEKRKLPRRSAEDTRAHVLDVAHDLFYWTGIRATGVDRVAADAGIAPTALYRLFPSKDALVAAYVERAVRLYQAWFDEVTLADGRSPAARIVALFDALAEQVQPDRCRGCPFLMTLTELPDTELAAHVAAVKLKKWVRGRIRRLVSELAAARPREELDSAALSDHLMLLFEGVYATVQALGAEGPARRAKKLVAALVNEARSQNSRRG